MKYLVLVDDNFHYQDESERYELGEYPTLAAAVEAAQQLVDDFLIRAWIPGMTAEALYRAYNAFGEDPWIISIPEDGGQIVFSAWDYAKKRAAELCLRAGNA